MCGANALRYSFSVLIFCIFALFNLINARKLASIKRANVKSFPSSVIDDETYVADSAYRYQLNEGMWDYFSFRNLRRSSKFLDLNSKEFGRKDKHTSSNLNVVHRRLLTRRQRSLDSEQSELWGTERSLDSEQSELWGTDSSMKDIDLDNSRKDLDFDNSGKYKIQKHQEQYTKESTSHINDLTQADSDTISSDRKQTSRHHIHSRHLNKAPYSSNKFESGFQTDGVSQHTAATGNRQDRHGAVQRHRHSGHSSRHLPDSSRNVKSEADATENRTGQKYAEYQSEDLQQFDAKTEYSSRGSNSNIHPDQTTLPRNANIQAASSQTYHQGFGTFLQNLGVRNARGLDPFNLDDALDGHIPRLDNIPRYMQHVYLLLSDEDNKEQMNGHMPTVRTVKLSPDYSSERPEFLFHLTGLITHQNIGRVDLVFDKPDCVNLPSLLEIVIEGNSGLEQEEVPYQERILVSKYQSFYRADMSLFVPSLMKDNITLLLKQVGDIDKDCFQHPLLVTYKDFDMIEIRQKRSSKSSAETVTSPEVIETDSVRFSEIMMFGLHIEQEPDPSACRRMNWFIDMRIFDFAWYVGPVYIDAHYCLGDCSNPLVDGSLNATNYSFIKTLYHEITNYELVAKLPRSSCVPISYLPQTILYRDEANGYVTKQLPNMKVKDCGCR